MTNLLWFIPVPQPYIVTQTFSQHPGYGKGTDFGRDNLPIYASRSGRVAQVTNNYYYPGNPGTGYANRVVIDHGLSEANKALVSYYAHLRPNIVARVGDLVSTGDIIAYSNNTGMSTGPHLHFETREGNVPFNHFPFFRTTVEEVEGGPPPMEVPTFPLLPKYKILASPYLNIRKRPGTASFVTGRIYKDTIVAGMSSTWLGSDLWIQIGYDQYIASYWQGNLYSEQVMEE